MVSGILPVALLMIEHRLIDKMPSILRREAAQALGGKVDTHRIDVIVDFMRNYADRCHHGKEEDVLFLEISKRRVPPALKVIMDELVAEHEVSRLNVRKIVDCNSRYRAGSASSLGEMASALETLADLYPNHIEKEDRRFFLPCMELFTSEEKKSMLIAFEDLDRRMVHESYRVMMEGLLSTRVVHPLRAARASKEEREGGWTCGVCDHVYSPAKGDPGRGIPPGTRFEDIPPDWTCPVCGAGKEAFHGLDKVKGR